MEKTLTLIMVHGLIGDEGALNLYARTRCKTFAQEWNFEVLLGIMKDPAITHFSGILKPWTTDIPIPFMKEWWKDADKSLKSSVC